MGVRDWLSVALAGFVLLGGAGYCAQWRAAAKAEGRAEQLQVTINSLKERIAARTDSIAALDSAAARQARELERRVDRERRAAERARSRADSLAVVVRENLPSSARAGFDSLQAAHFREVEALDAIIVAKDKRIVDLERQVAIRDRLNADLRAALEKTEAQRDLWKKRARPGFFAEVGDDLPKILGGAAVGAIAVLVTQ